ncbi:MAG: MoaD/ThiS family protein [Deltaproteobacteria bacterium]|nr:MoaD/ThiS family protein [Deltaproteobacteria bacterium]
MRLRIDDLEETWPDGLSLGEILRRRGDPADHVLVELNGVHVRRDELDRTFPKAGDAIEVLLPAHGG